MEINDNMESLLNNVMNNYNIEIDSVEAKGDITINNILLLKGKEKYFILKLYNVGEGNQIINSAKIQKIIHDKIGISPDVVYNNNKSLCTQYNAKFYTIQEYIQEENIEIDMIEQTAKELALMHNELRKVDYSGYKIKNNNKTYNEILEGINRNKEIIEKVQNQKNKKIFFALIKKREELLKEYKCSYNPNKSQIIHGDIRPRNMIFNDDNVYFIDFDYVMYGDLLFEIGSSAMLISKFNIEEAKRFLKIYNEYSKDEQYIEQDVFRDLLSYYIKSDFPIKLIGKIENEPLQKMAEERIKSLDFCDKLLKYKIGEGDIHYVR